MADVTSGAVSTETPGGVTAATSGAESTGTGEGGKSAADTIRDLRLRAQQAETRAETLAKAEAKRLESEALARGEHEQVISRLREENERLSAVATQFESAQTARREALLTGLAEEDRTLADGLPLDKLEGLVARLGRPAGPAPVPVRPGVPGGAAPQTERATPDEVRANISNPQWYAANRHRL